MRESHRVNVRVGPAMLLLFACAAAAAPGGGVDFERDVAPVLVQHCLDCHQPTKASGGLNLATLESALAGGDSGAALVPGKSTDGRLLERVEAGEMPPADAKDVQHLSPPQIDTLRAWIAGGASWPRGRELGIHERTVDLDKARSFWSFRPVERPPVPTVNDPGGAANPIDAFVLARLEAEGLTLSPAASKADLLRRASLDVRGLPPSLEEQANFAADTRPEAAADMIDRFLTDAAYGERWARHWLDVVRYADSSGYERDGPKPSVWRYRDYVIKSLNDDKPYDRFVVEQLAGDELPDATPEALVATGFHALGTWNDEVDPLEAAQYRADELDDMVRTTSQAFLGVTLGCARCHNHKFDPFTMVDYYSLAAVLDPLKRPNVGRTDRDLPLGTPDEVAAEKRRDEAIAELQRQIDELTKKQAAEPAVAQGPQIAELRARQEGLRQAAPALPRAYRLYEDSPDAPVTRLLLSGRASNPGPVMQPRVPAVLTAAQPAFPAPGPRSTLRRLTFARWVASAGNPLTARVIVNRVWQHHFGKGLVATPGDFGQTGARPTHPDLLDWLAHWFVHDAGWSLKKLHRLILTSRTYQQGSAWNESAAAKDPENTLLWRYPYRRLDAEAIRDSMLAVAGNLNREMYGPAVYLPIPQAAVEAHTDKHEAWKVSAEPDINRRTVYAYVKRTLIVPMLETLDFCDTTQSAERRAVTSVAPQALTLFNGEFVNRQAQVFARRVAREAGPEPGGRVRFALRAALAREPTGHELAAMRAFMEREAAAGGDRDQALVQLCRVILNLNEFVYPN